jgi:hypothetical protein
MRLFFFSIRQKILYSPQSSHNKLNRKSNPVETYKL